MVAARPEAADAGTAWWEGESCLRVMFPPRGRRPRSHLAHDDRHLGDRARRAGRLAARLDDHLKWPSRPLPRRRSRPLGHPAHHRRRSARGGRRAAAVRRDRSRQRARRHRRLHAARAPGARRRDGTHVRNPRSALDARRRVGRGRHLARDRAARQPRRAPRARGRRAGGCSDGMARPTRARPAHGQA
jgi:hypothetical protein